MGAIGGSGDRGMRECCLYTMGRGAGIAIGSGVLVTAGAVRRARAALQLRVLAFWA